MNEMELDIPIRDREKCMAKIIKMMNNMVQLKKGYEEEEREK